MDLREKERVGEASGKRVIFLNSQDERTNTNTTFIDLQTKAEHTSLYVHT